MTLTKTSPKSYKANYKGNAITVTYTHNYRSRQYEITINDIDYMHDDCRSSFYTLQDVKEFINQKINN